MKRERVRLADATWLMLESRERPMHVATLLIYSLPPDAPRDFLAKLVAGLRQSTEFVSPFNLKLADPRLKAVAPVWVHDHDLDLEYHVRHLALPWPGGERELGVLISRLHSNPMDFNRPLWEYYVIEGLENNRFAISYKMHHSIVDGVSGVRMLLRSMSTRVEDTDTPALWSARIAAGDDTAAPALQEASDNLVSKVSATVESLVGASRGVVETLRAARDTENPVTLPFQTPMSILNHRIRGQRRFATQIYDFSRIRALAKAGNCTVNDVVLALSSGALRRFLKELGVLPGRSLTAGIPVSLRTKDDQGSGTAVSFMIANLATNIADPVRRLEAIAASTRSAKALMAEMPRSTIETYSAAVMAPYSLQVLVGLEGRTRPVFNVPISNVPGPSEPLYFRGARLEAMYPVSAVTHGQALNITCYSYAGTLSFGFAACRDTLPHMQRLAVFTRETLEELEQSLAQRQVSDVAPAALPPTREKAPRVRRKTPRRSG